MARVLIIDDDPQVCELLTVMLNAEKYFVETAYDGIEALNIYKSSHFDLVITDILMPRRDGIDTIMKLVELGEDTPIIAISGGRRTLSSEFNLESAKLVGAKAILKKPFTDIQLREAIKEATA